MVDLFSLSFRVLQQAKLFGVHRFRYSTLASSDTCILIFGL